MKKVIFSIATILAVTLAFAGEKFIGSKTIGSPVLSLLEDGGIFDAGIEEVGIIPVPQGSLLTLQVGGPQPQDVDIMFAALPDAGLFDAGMTWRQEPKKLLPTSTRYDETAVMFRIAEPDGGQVTLKVFSRTGNE